MNYETIISDIKARKFNPIYFLMGDEGFFIDEIMNLLEKSILSPEEKAFNQLVLYGKDVSVEEVIGAARRYPMMSPYQVVIVKEAQHINNIEQLSIYADNPMQTTVLIVCYRGKTLDGRKGLAKKLLKSFVLFTAKKLYDNQVPQWIEKQLKAKSYTISPKASFMLTEYLGANLGKISNEISKLQLILPKGTNILPIHIQENIGISKDYNVFELQNALGERNINKVLKIVHYFEANPKDNPLAMIIPLLYGFFSKILLLHYLSKEQTNDSLLASRIGVNRYFIKDYRIAMNSYTIRQTVKSIAVLRNYDMKSKGVGSLSASEGQLLHELILKILYL